MSGRTTIEWTHMPGYVGGVWNPTTGCTRVSADCDNCYAFALHDHRYKVNLDTAHAHSVQRFGTDPPRHEMIEWARGNTSSGSRSSPMGDSACVIWSGRLTEKGYGEMWKDGRRRRAHVVAYEERFGPVPDGLELNHLCRVRACVNPEHLEAVTHAENMRRGDRAAMGSSRRSRTHCPKGHPYDERNTMYRPNGKRRCRECARIDNAARRAVGLVRG